MVRSTLVCCCVAGRPKAPSEGVPCICVFGVSIGVLEGNLESLSESGKVDNQYRFDLHFGEGISAFHQALPSANQPFVSHMILESYFSSKSLFISFCGCSRCCVSGSQRSSGAFSLFKNEFHEIFTMHDFCEMVTFLDADVLQIARGSSLARISLLCGVASSF